MDGKRGFVFVACSDHVIVLNANRSGQNMGSVQVGEGIDNIDYSDEAGLVYAAASDAAVLVIAKVDKHGKPTTIATVPTVKGARSVVAGSGGGHT